MRRIIFCLAVITVFVSNTAMAKCRGDEARAFINEIVAKIEPVLKENASAYWMATTTGEKSWYKKYEEKEIEYRRIMSDKQGFEKVKSLRDSTIKDPMVKRQIDLIYLDFLENQIDPKLNEEMVRRGAELEKKFNTYRAKLGGVNVSDNNIRELMRKSTDLAEREKVWEASKQIGAVVANDLITLVKRRNEAARQLGFKNYYVMRLELQEQNEKDLFAQLDKLAKLTEGPFKELKTEMDAALAKRYGIKAADLRPWHYEDVFFQEAPQVYNVDLDKYFADRDVVKLIKDYYAGIGMPADDILARSDLFERNGKEQHAYCIHIDRRGDVRILANVKPSEYWAGTMLHETGHAVYEKYFDADLPFLLREPAHTFTTEAIAMLFERLTTDPAWLASKVDSTKRDELNSLSKNLWSYRRAAKLIFARWDLVMSNFERALYSNPDQDLNKLWWNMVEKYQLVHRPEGRDNPDWAAKIHFTSSPVYYHNYLLGELFASQLVHYIDKNIVKKEEAFIDNRKLGEYLKEKVFSPGDKMRWDKFIKFATGERFTPKYFAREFVR